MFSVDSVATGVSREYPNMSLQDPVTSPQIAMIHTVSGLIPLFDGLVILAGNAAHHMHPTHARCRRITQGGGNRVTKIRLAV